MEQGRPREGVELVPQVNDGIKSRDQAGEIVALLQGKLYNLQKKKVGAPSGNENASNQSGKSCHIVKTSSQIAAHTGTSGALRCREAARRLLNAGRGQYLARINNGATGHPQARRLTRSAMA